MSPFVVSTTATLRTKVRSRAKTAIQRALVSGPAPAALVVSDVVLRHLRPARITTSTIAALFPELSAAERIRLRRAISTDVGRSRIAGWYVRYRDPQALRDVVNTSGFDRLGAGPAIFLSFHFGAWVCLDQVLRWHGYESLVITAIRSRPGAALLRLGSTLEERTAVAQRAAVRLREGGFVMMAGDGMAGETGIPVQVLSQRPVLRPGLATLARLSGAPVFPVSGTWQGRRIQVEVHEPLCLPQATARDEFLQQTAERVGAWLDRQLRQSPAGLTPGLVSWLFNRRPRTWM